MFLIAEGVIDFVGLFCLFTFRAVAPGTAGLYKTLELMLRGINTIILVKVVLV
jgi:hypothetical protein